MKPGTFKDFSGVERTFTPDDIAEIAGTGEPTLCEWLPDLLQYLEAQKAWVVLRTNGCGLGYWRKPLDRLLVVLSKHDSSDEYIIRKCEYLLRHDLIMKDALENFQDKSHIASNFKTDALSPYSWHDVERAFFITPDGKVRFMPCVSHDLGTVWNYKPEAWICTNFARCHFALGAYNLIEYLKAPFDLPAGYTHVQVGSYHQAEPQSSKCRNRQNASA